MFCATAAQQNQARTESQTCFRRSALKKKISPSHLNEYRASMHGGVACRIARADLHAMMMGSLTDDQIRHSPDYIDGAS